VAAAAFPGAGNRVLIRPWERARSALPAASIDPECAASRIHRTRRRRVPRSAPSFDCEAFMDYRSPLQHLLQKMLPAQV